MHELSIAQNIVASVVDYLERHHPHCNKVAAVGVRVGLLTDLSPDALAFGYEVSCKGTALDGSTIEIERVPVTALCQDCGKRTTVENLLFRCSDCQSGNIEMETGMELDLAWVQIESDSAIDKPVRLSVEHGSEASQ